MADRTDFHFRQKVTEAELDLAFALLEKADRNLAADIVDPADEASRPLPSGWRRSTGGSRPQASEEEAQQSQARQGDHRDDRERSREGRAAARPLGGGAAGQVPRNCRTPDWQRGEPLPHSDQLS